jgi:hypothetical protein
MSACLFVLARLAATAVTNQYISDKNVACLRYGAGVSPQGSARGRLVRVTFAEKHAEVRLRVRPKESVRIARRTVVVGFGDGRCVFGELVVVLVLVLGPL